MLSGGRPSNYYCEAKKSTLYPSDAKLIGEILVDAILDSGAEAIGGLEIGSIPISMAVGFAALERQRVLPTFIIRKEAKRHGTRDRVAEAYAEDEHLLVPGRRVAIVDDVITTGGSVAKAIEVVSDLGCRVVMVISLVERHESDGKALRGRGFPVMRVLYTDERGQLYIDEEFVRRAEEAAEARLPSR